MKAFRSYAESAFGSWTINVLSVVAGILVLKLLISQLPQNDGPIAAIKAAVNTI